MSRGNNKQNIFLDKTDYEVFLRILAKTQEKYKYKLHAYCLMTNHIHLLLETGEVETGYIMQYMLSDYARYFNKKYNRIGHLFQGRYKDVLVKNDRYFLATSRYIHLNPVKAFLVNKPESYQYSSYRAFISDKKISQILTKEKTLEYFPKPADLEYKTYVEEALVDQEFEEAIQNEIGEAEEAIVG